MKKLCLLLLCISNAGRCYLQQLQQLALVDSVVFTSKLESGSAALDVNLVGGACWARFDSWQPAGIFIELVSEKGQRYVFRTTDSSIASEFGPMYAVKDGFLIPKYSGAKKLAWFDTLKREMRFSSPGASRRNFILYPSSNGFLRTSAGYNGRYIFTSRISMDVNSASKNKLAASLNKIFDKEKLLVRFDLSTGLHVSFVRYPEIYRQTNFLVANKDYFFTASEDGSRLYVTYQASDRIEVYDTETLQQVATWKGSVSVVDSTKLLAAYKDPADYTNKDFLNLLADSYDEVHAYRDGLMRLFKKGYDRDELRQMEPPADKQVCATPQMKLKWVEKLMNKKMFLQQFDSTGVILKELEVPDFVNTFTGYDRERGLYLFWKKTQTASNGKLTVYIMKAVE